MSNTLARPRAALFVVLTLLLAALSVPSFGARQAAAASCDTGTNLALNKTATASSIEGAGTPASAAVDGNTGTRWSSQFSDPQWLQVDLGSTQSICEVVLNWETAAGKAYQIQTSNDGSTWTSIYSTTTGTGGTETLNVSGSGRYIRMYGTARTTGYGYSLWEFSVYGGSNGGGGTPPPPTGGSLGSNVIVFSPSMSQASIQSQLNAISDQQVPSEFGTGRYELLFQPGTYGSAASPLIFTVGFYEAVAGLGHNPGDVTVNGTVDSYNQCSGGTCNATTNFWRSLSNLTINVTGMSGCQAGDDFWAVSQAAPMRRVHINGNVSLMDYCVGGPGYASGGFIADSQFTGGTVTNGSQQQYITRNSAIDGWSNGVWNQVFCGDPGAPAQSFASNSGLSGGPAPYTNIGNCPVTREAPYLYQDSGGNYNVFVPSLATNSNGPSWANGSTPGTSLSLNTFFVVQPSATVAQINAALDAGDNLLFTPGVYNVPSTIDVTKADADRRPGLRHAGPNQREHHAERADVSGVTDQRPDLRRRTDHLALAAAGRHRGLDHPARLRPGLAGRRVLPRRRRDRGLGDHAAGRQQQRLAAGRRVDLARGPRCGRRDVDRRPEPDRAGGEREQRHLLRPGGRALPAERSRLERPERHGHLLPEREPLRGAQPGLMDGLGVAEGVPGAVHPELGELLPGLRAGQLQLLQPGRGHPQLDGVPGAADLRGAAARPADGVLERLRRDRLGRERDREGGELGFGGPSDIVTIREQP